MNTNEQRPGDPITALDAAWIATSMDEMRKALLEDIKKTRGELRQELQALAARMATLQRDELQIKDLLTSFSADLAETRIRRLEEEIEEAERERRILEQRLQIVDERLLVKKSDTAGAVDTNERMKKAAELTYAEREKLRREKNAEWWHESFRLAGRAVVISFAVGVAGGLVGFAWWLVQLYLGR